MPADAWVLLVVSVGLGLGLELAYMRARRRERRAGSSTGSDEPATVDFDEGRRGSRRRGPR